MIINGVMMATPPSVEINEKNLKRTLPTTRLRSHSRHFLFSTFIFVMITKISIFIIYLLSIICYYCYNNSPRKRRKKVLQTDREKRWRHEKAPKFYFYKKIESDKRKQIKKVGGFRKREKKKPKIQVFKGGTRALVALQ